MKNLILLFLAIIVYSCSSGDDTPPSIIAPVVENNSEATSENTETAESADSETTVVKYTLTVTSDDGGSVSSKNINELKNIDLCDGFLIGGASLKHKNFIDIIKKYYN